MTNLIVLLATLVLALGVALVFALRSREKNYAKFLHMVEQYNNLLSQKKSSETRLGQVAEQMAPFLAGFPHDPKNAHFIGQPIDYIIFDDDGVVILEVKSGQASLTQRQKIIKDHIIHKRIRWEEYRIDGKVSGPSEVQSKQEATVKVPEVLGDVPAQTPGGS